MVGVGWVQPGVLEAMRRKFQNSSEERSGRKFGFLESRKEKQKREKSTNKKQLEALGSEARNSQRREEREGALERRRGREWSTRRKEVARLVPLSCFFPAHPGPKIRVFCFRCMRTKAFETKKRRSLLTMIGGCWACGANFQWRRPQAQSRMF